MSQEQVVVITGASRGIGAALALDLAKRGYKVVINYRASEDEALHVADTINEQVGPEQALVVQANVGKRSDVASMFDYVLREWGQVDVLINNAGLNLDGPFLQMTDDQWQQVIDTNLTGTFLCSQEFARRFQGTVGHIVNIAAATGLRGRKNGVNYCSSKAGVITLTKCLALELAPKIRVNCVIPGYMNTAEVITRYHLDDKEHYDRIVGTIPMNRLGTPDDICRMAAFLLRDAEYITGQNFFVNGGNFMY